MNLVRVAALFVYPIKSCAGILVDAMHFDALGPLDDRRWMVVDAHGAFITHRELPRLCLVRPARIDGGLRVLAPGMPALQVSGRGGAAVDAWCWDHRCRGFDEGPQVAEWLSDYLGQSVRLLRFDPACARPVSQNWLAGLSDGQAFLTRFTDGFPLTLIARASLEAFNLRLAQMGLPPRVVQHFRPNVVIDGLAPFAEDQWSQLTTTAEIGATLNVHLVKPGACDATIEIDLQSGRHEPGVLPVLASFRAHPELGGAPVLGWNAVVTQDGPGVLRLGDCLRGTERPRLAT